MPLRAASPERLSPLASRLRLRQLALVVAIDAARSLRRAAEAIAVTQPAATRLLRELEEALGAALFVRHPWGMEPTAYGDAFVRYARSVLAETGEARAEIDLLKAGARGLLRIGCVTGAVPGWLVPALNAVRRSRDGLRTFLLVNTSDVLADALLGGTLDLAIGRLPANSDPRAFVAMPLGTEPLRIVARASHPLGRRARLKAADLAASTWILQPPGSPMRQEANAELDRLGVRLGNAVIETASIVATLALLRDTDALSVMPEGLARHYAAPGWVAALRLPETPATSRYEVIVRSGRPLSPAADAFVTAVRGLPQANERAERPRKAKRRSRASPRG
jgi:DNA-binding transcriptional LysR family regulator